MVLEVAAATNAATQTGCVVSGQDDDGAGDLPSCHADTVAAYDDGDDGGGDMDTGALVVDGGVRKLLPLLRPKVHDGDRHALLSRCYCSQPHQWA